MNPGADPVTAPYHSDGQITLYHGDALAVLRTLPDASVNACVTSPPYFGLRDYGVDGQYGLEASPAEYVETMRGLFGRGTRRTGRCCANRVCRDRPGLDLGEVPA